MKIKAGILIDFGNSETRMTMLINGKATTRVLSNKFAALTSEYVIPVEYNNDKTTVLCVNGTYYANGALAEREFAGQLIRPSSVQHKTEQLVTELSLNLVLLKAIEMINASGTPWKETDFVFDVSVMLPPVEQSINTLKMTELVKSVTSVVSYIPLDLEKSVQIENVKVVAEGVAAFFGVYYSESDDTLVENMNNIGFATGNVLVLDIGAGTTDIVLIKDSELVQESKETFNIGGNTVESQLRKLVNNKYGYAPSNLKEIVETGLLKDGAISHDISEMVTSAKATYTKMLIPELMGYLERLMLSMREVKGLLVVGGGSLPSVYGDREVSPAMSSVLIAYFKKLSPNISLMDIGDKNPRFLNIEGLKYIHKYS